MTPAFSLGAVPVDGGRTRFTVWAPGRRQVVVSFPGSDRVVELTPRGGGYHEAVVDGCGPGERYQLLLDGDGPFADPASRAQPEGVHGPSQVVDLRAHQWGDAGHRARPLWQQVISEVHVGTFTPGGTFDSAVAGLDDLVEVGISAVELMPVAQFPGRRNWGYDGVFPFAVQSSYGGAGGLQRFVDACHARGLDVILDVVYNHLGPEGNILGAFGPYFTDRYRTPWGPAVNFDGAGSNDVRAFFLESARQWLTEFHIDGLRLDAVHEIIDRSAIPFLSELATTVGAIGDRFLVAESADNNPRLVTPISAGGLGMDAQWNDDFHHALHAAITGERNGYYLDFGPVDDIARAMDEGFVYQGEYSKFRNLDHGGPSVAIAPERFVVFAQNHDHIGNRPKGDRLVSLVTPEQAQLAAALVLLAPGVPLLFMGEEYGDPAPFPYFIDHGDPALVEAVRAGRAHEFAAFADSGAVLDAGAQATFDAARIDPSLRHEGEYRPRWALHRALIGLRRGQPALQRSSRSSTRATASSGVVTLIRADPHGAVAALFNVSSGPNDAVLPPPPPGWPQRERDDPRGADDGRGRSWSKLLDARAPEFGGHGDTLPDLLAPGDRAPLGPWGFCAYGLSGNRGDG
jgi:maltooligosyltrehalose trehalohydrolase